MEILFFFILTKMRKDILIAALNNMFSDRLRDIFKIDLITYSRSEEITAIQSFLNELAKNGYIEILKPIDTCENMEPCIRLKSRIPLP